jgi:SAM-dependent methyltransferase
LAQLYTHPDDFDLEHLGESEDVEFYVNLAKRLRPRRILELACGTGRVTIPLAEAGFEVVGVDNEPEMVTKANDKRAALSSKLSERLEFVEGDMRTWSDNSPFDLILIPCGSITHLLELEDQLTTWRKAFSNLSRGGRLVVDTVMPNFAAYADSLATPQRSVVELDRDIVDDKNGIRLLRQKTTNYIAESQRAKILFQFEKIADGYSVERYVDDFESHVYFPRELQLLFICAGFEVETVYGDFRDRPLATKSPAIIVVGRKPI